MVCCESSESFKKKETLLADHNRLYMAQLAIGDNDKIKASDIEFKLPVPSYTIDTLTYLNEKYQKNKFCLVMGEDNLYTLHKWKNAAELAAKYPIYVYPRPDSVKPVSPILDQIINSADIHYIKAPLMEISGTFIRDGIKEEKTCHTSSRLQYGNIFRKCISMKNKRAIHHL